MPQQTGENECGCNNTECGRCFPWANREMAQDYGLTGAEIALAAAEKRVAELEADLRRQWQPIETAPKDGTRIIVYRRVGVWNVMGTAEWVDVRGIAGWLARGFGEPPGELGLAAPTHWMPLPPTPAPR